MANQSVNFALTSLLCLTACVTQPPPSPPAALQAPGRQPDGSILLPNQWSLRPAGRQVVVGDFPVNMAVHPQGRFAAVLHSGYGQHEVVILDLRAGSVFSRASLDESFYGLAFSLDGNTLYCSGASAEIIHTFAFNQGYLSTYRSIPLRDANIKAIPAGLSVTKDDKQLYIANLWGHSLTRVELTPDGPKVTDLPLSTATSAKVEPTPPKDEDTAAINKRAEALLEPTDSQDPFPYATLLDEQNRRLYVSLWAQAAVAVIDLDTWTETARWPVEEHPNEMLLAGAGRHLFVANANRNSVSILDTSNGHLVETLLAELHPNSPPGSTPNSLALSPNEEFLFVANANINTIAVFEVENPGRSRSLGFIPVGWYPTSVRLTPDGRQLLVANGKGIMPKANRHGPQPGNDPPANLREYIGGLFQGTVSIIPLTTGEEFEQQMKRHSVEAFKCPPSTAAPGASDPRSPDNPIPAQLGDPSPIKYCIYILKENRTYDQVLGDLPLGNGDPSLCLFPESVTPNHHKLARDFVVLDNFYVESEVSADGHEWSVGAYATDFVEKSWPLSYGHNQRNKHVYPSEGRFQIAQPAGGYLWDSARQAGVSYRSYGEFIDNGATPDDPATSRVKTLQGHFDPWFRSFDMDYPDVKRAERFISELKRFEAEGDMPQLQIVRLPSDHTSGTAAGKLTPTAQVADNDLALGMVVEALTHSKFWPQMAIFVVEDDAQNGPDHVDAHRTIAYAISPYIRRHSVDSTMYSTTSMLRTIELILGLQPMSQFDAAAKPMYASFQARPDLRPYQAQPVEVDREERNLKTAWGSEQSLRMDFTREDAADDILLNEIIWKSTRGPDKPMPAPVRAAFVFPQDEDDD